MEQLSFSRRLALSLPLTLPGFVLAESAQAKEADYALHPRTKAIIGYMPAQLDLDYGAGAVYSSAVGSFIAFTYSEGIGARFSTVNLETGQQVLVLSPFHQNYDRPEAFITYSNRQTVTLASSGLVIHFNPNTLGVMTYRRDTRAGRESVEGQISNIAIGSSTWPKGLDKSYVGDFQGRLCRFILPPNSSTPQANIWVSYGRPFGASSSILSTAFHAGFLYLGIRGEKGGIYRISEKTLDEAASQGRFLSYTDFENLTPSPAQGLLPAREYRPHQLLITGSRKGPLLVARISGDLAVRIPIESLGNKGETKLLGSPFPLSQIATADGQSLITRLKEGQDYYLIRLDMNSEHPYQTRTYLANTGPGALTRQTPLIRVKNRTCLLTSYQEGLLVSPLGPGATSYQDSSVEKPILTIGEPELVAAERTQLRNLVYLPSSEDQESFLVYTPYWIHDQRIGLIDRPHAVPADSNKSRIRLQSSPERNNFSSSQIESIAYTKSGLISLGTYPGGGAQLISPGDYPADSETSEKLLAQDQGDLHAARLACQANLSDGNLIYGATGKFDKGAGGLAIFKATSVSSSPSMQAYPANFVLENQNITSLCVISGDKEDTVLAGGSTRLENSVLASGQDPEEDAKIAILSYEKEDQSLKKTKIIGLPAGIKAVWDIIRHSSGRIFLLAQYGHHMKVEDQKGNLVEDANVLLELDPKDFSLIPLGKQGKGYFIRSTPRTRFAGYGTLKEAPNGQLLVRTNVFLYAFTLGAQGIKSLIPMPMTAVNFDIGSGGELYTVSFDGYVRRFTYQ